MKINIFLILILLIANQAFALKVGVTAGPHITIMEEVKKEAEKANLEIQIVEFNDFIMPNEALDSGEIDVNSYQHQPFLDEQVKTRNYKIVSIGKTILLPLGIYSAKHKNLEQIKEGSKISIPNDPTNGGRALLLLQKAQLINLRKSDNPTILDIIDNPQGIKIVELEAPQIPRTLLDVDYAIINTDWILVAGVDPNSALLKEDKDSIYVNVIAIREKDRSREDIAKFLAIYQSKHIKEFINTQFKGAVLPAW